MGHVFKYKDNSELGLYFERVVTQSIILKKEPVCFTLVPGHRNQNAESEQIYIWKKRCRYLKVLIANMCFHKRIWKAGTPFSCNKVILCHQQVPCVIACTTLLNFWKFHTCMQWRMIISTPFPPSHFSQLPFNMRSLNFMSFFFFKITAWDYQWSHPPKEWSSFFQQLFATKKLLRKGEWPVNDLIIPC